jgi:hypothetical protein
MVTGSQGPDCKNVAQCRLFDEIVFIAFCKVKTLKKLISTDIFLLKMEKSMQQGGVSKFQVVTSGQPQMGKGMSSSAILK